MGAREHVGVVLQEPFLFSRTIAENIGICGADEAAIREAAKTACIADDIEGFANGYETMVGERGVTLSGGQKQRVAIARMLTQKTPVTVFDDSLSAVDTQTDEKIRAALARERKAARRASSFRTASRRCWTATTSSCSTTGRSCSSALRQAAPRGRPLPADL